MALANPTFLSFCGLLTNQAAIFVLPTTHTKTHAAAYVPTLVCGCG